MIDYQKAISKFDIVSKEGKTVPFVLNKEQTKLLRDMTGRDIILKSRQIGFSSLILAVFTINFLLKENSRGVILSHDGESAQRLLDRAKFFIESAEQKGLAVNLKYNSRHEMVNSDKNSSLYIGKAGSKAFGRGDTINNCHLSEFAWYENSERLLASIFQAVVPKGGKVFIESTANGLNFFKDFWERTKASKTGFKSHFFGNNHYSEGFLTQKKMELGPELFKQEYPANDVECFLFSGTPYFDQDILNHYLSKAIKPIRVGGFVGLNPPVFEDNKHGYWKIWEMPIGSHTYILTADVAEKRDWCAGAILDRQSFKLVATFHGHLESTLYAEELARGGKYFNQALIAVEKNNQGLAVLQRLRSLHYPTLYQRKVIDSATKNESTDLGWLTTSKTRPLMLANLQSVIKEKTLWLPDAETIKEMMAFARNDKGRPEALSGSFDDRVICLAIAITIYQIAPETKENFDMVEWEFQQERERRELFPTDYQ